MLNAERTLIFVKINNTQQCRVQDICNMESLVVFNQTNMKNVLFPFSFLKPNFLTTFHLTIVTYYEQYREPLCSNNCYFYNKTLPKTFGLQLL